MNEGELRHRVRELEDVVAVVKRDLESRLQEAADAKFVAEKLRQQLSTANAELERLRTTVAEQQSDIGWMRNRIAELHAATAAEGESDADLS